MDNDFIFSSGLQAAEILHIWQKPNIFAILRSLLFDIVFLLCKKIIIDYRYQEVHQITISVSYRLCNYRYPLTPIKKTAIPAEYH